MNRDALTKQSLTCFEAAYTTLKKDYTVLYEQFQEQTETVKTLEARLKFYEEQFKLFQQRKFSSSTEKHGQLSFSFDGIDVPPGQAKSVKDTITYTRRRCGKKSIDTSKLPRHQVHHDLLEQDTSCDDCGEQMQQWGESVTESLETIPRQCFVVEHVRPKYKCTHCHTLKQSPAIQASPLPKSFAGSSLIADVIINKYQYHQPLYRQSQQLKSHGLNIGDNTLGHWVMASAEQLSPLSQGLWSEALKNGYLQIDETPVKVLVQKNKAYMWVYLNPITDLVIYDYQDSRRGHSLNHRLSDYQGCIQNDGYAGYNELRRREGIEGFGCMAHARRKFFEIVKMSQGAKGVAYQVVALIKQLYYIEANAREAGLDPPARQALREAEANPVLDEILTLLHRTHAPPESALGKAVRYTLAQWPYLVKYVHHGQVEIDNNLVENAIRPFALGRKNWLFLGHDESAAHTSLLYSLIESAKRQGILPYNYLHYLLTQVHALRRKAVNPVDLLPHRIDRDTLDAFAKKHQQQLQKALNLSQ